MKKIFKSLTVIMCSLFILPNVVSAATNDWGLGAGEATALPCAVTTAAATTCSGEYVLTSDITLAGLVRWNGDGADIVIDLNGHNIVTNNAIALVGGPTITIKDSVGGGFIKSTGGTMGAIYIQEGHFTIESGKITSSVPNNVGLIVVKGGVDSLADLASVVIGKDAILDYEGTGYGYGVTVDKRTVVDAVTNKESYYSYGVSLDINGTIDVSATNGYAGVYVQGTIKDKDNAPIINIGSTAVIEGAGPGIYAAGYATWTFAEGSSVTGVDSALAIKAGKFTINGGTFTVTGPDTTPTTGWGSGVNASGAVIQIESSTGYAGEIDMSINGGTFTSAEGVVFYEYVAEGANTSVTGLEITDGTFVAADGKEVFLLSEEFEEDFATGFISGGTFSSDPSAYINEELEATVDKDGNFIVGTIEEEDDESSEPTDNTSSEDEEENPDTGDINLIFMIITTLIAGLGIALASRKLKNQAN